jgi:hypothetical protein
MRLFVPDAVLMPHHGLSPVVGSWGDPGVLVRPGLGHHHPPGWICS